MKNLISLFLVMACILTLFVGCASQEDDIAGINDYTPIALIGNIVVYNYISNDNTLVFGCYESVSKKYSDVMSVDKFYISSGIPAVIDSSVILPVTLNTNEHNLLMINADSDTAEILFSEFNSYPIDTVCAMNKDIYILSTMKDNLNITSYIRKYNKSSGGMDICIEKKSVNDVGEQIKAFACNNGNIYVMVNNTEIENDTYIEIYDSNTYDFLGKLDFDCELRSFVSDSDIAEFYCFDSYAYIRNFSDYGIIGKMSNEQIEAIFNLSNFRMAYNGKNANDNYYGFFLRGGKDFYTLDIHADTLYKTRLELSQDESIRNVISDGNNVCISILDEKDTESFTTKSTVMTDFDKLVKKAYQVKEIDIQ